MGLNRTLDATFFHPNWHEGGHFPPPCPFLSHFRGVSGGWAGWTIVHPDFDRIEGAAGQWQRMAAGRITTCQHSVW